MLYVAAGYLSEFKVSCDVGGYEDVCEFTICHEQFRDEVNVPVIGPAVLLPGFFALFIVAVSFEELMLLEAGDKGAEVEDAYSLEVDGGCFAISSELLYE